jgi:hypothetical protein
VGEERVAKEMGHAALPDFPGADMLVAVGARAEFRLGVVEMDHRQPADPDPGIERRQELVDPVGVGQAIPRAPGVGRVQAEGDPFVRNAPGGDRVGDVGELLDRRPDPEAAAR